MLLPKEDKAKLCKDFGERYIMSNIARPFRFKNRAARTNDRSGNKKKIQQFCK